VAAAVGVHLPCAVAAPLGVDGDHDALASHRRGGVRHDLGIQHRGGVDGHLVRAVIQQASYVLDSAHAAADRQRHEALLRRAAHDVQDDVAFLVRGGDVEEDELVSSLLVVHLGGLDGVSRVLEADEVDAFDDSPCLNVQARDDAFREHG